MNIEYKNGNVILVQDDLDLDETLDCGQAFRWEKINSEYDKTYKGAFLNTPLTISQSGNSFIFHEVRRDQKMIDDIIRMESDFWNGNVLYIQYYYCGKKYTFFRR